MAHERLLPAHERYLHAGTGAAYIEHELTAAAQRFVGPSGRASEAPKRGARARLAGALLLACVLGLLANPQLLPQLARVQTGMVYKLATGGTLLAFMTFQWMLAIARSRRWLQASRRLYALHQTVGLCGPLLLYVHASRWGFGYLSVLAAALLTNHAIGLVHGTERRLPRWIGAGWLATHVALSVLLLVLTGYHTWQVLYRE